MSTDLWAAFGTDNVQPAAPPKPNHPRPANVLFDAETEQDEADDFGDFEQGEDDFGDFEEAEDYMAPAPVITKPEVNSPVIKIQSATSAIKTLPSADLSLIDFDTPIEPMISRPPTQAQTKQPTPRQSRSQTQITLPIRGLPTQLRPVKSPAPIIDDIDEDAWADFDDMPAPAPIASLAPTKATGSQPQTSSQPAPSTKSPVDPSFDAFEGRYASFQRTSFDTLRNVIPTLDTNSSLAEGALPASNVPPPAIILSIFPTIFSQANSALTHILDHDLTVLSRFFTEARVQIFFKAYLALCSVCAFVLAGRKQRWRRDKLLSQSMRIGEAGSKIKGMKIASVDKSEVAREDQEAVEVLRAWKGQLGRLRRCVVEVRKVSSSVKLPNVPDLGESMSVKVLKEADGGIRSSQPCALCGLLREERVIGVELDVHDSFGEWWIDSAHMHRYCRNFWDQHKSSLKSR